MERDGPPVPRGVYESEGRRFESCWAHHASVVAHRAHPARPALGGLTPPGDWGAGEDCGKGSWRPAFIRIDVANQAVIGAEADLAHPADGPTPNRCSKAPSSDTAGSSRSIDQKTGKMTATRAYRENVCVLFGACTVP